MAERLRVALASTDIELAYGRRFQVTASFGVAVKGDLTCTEDLFAAADQALYEAKRAGKNRISPGLVPAPGAQTGPTPERRLRPAVAAKKPAAALSKAAEPKPSTRNTRSTPANRPAESEI